MRKPILLLLLFIATVFTFSGCASTGYITRAYVYPGSNTSLRGYPTIDPPERYTGRWTHYTYTGRTLAVLQYRAGDEDGRQVYLDDRRQPYLIRYIRNGCWHHDELQRPAPKLAPIPWFFPQRWLNPSLRGAHEIERLRLQPTSPNHALQRTAPRVAELGVVRRFCAPL